MAEASGVSFESAHCSEAPRERSEAQHLLAAGNTAVGSLSQQAHREGGVG